ncbi:luciferin sulfotransferase-like [Culicoides brevitarsis]|uniref:luciferin sulfotransferase-like n=1 Tax=Culicoides brevitarsis TaxID=469753 RepID=UPI00307BCBCD
MERNMEFSMEEVSSKYLKFRSDLKYYKYKWVSPPKTPLGPDYDFQGFCMPETHKQYAKMIREFKIRPDDVFVCGYPKSGTSWLQEMVWLLGNDLNYRKAEKISQMFRFPLLELASNLPVDQSISVVLDQIDLIPSPRFIKSHLPVGHLPEELWSVKPKIIQIQRNSKDAAVSLLHHYRSLHAFNGTKDEFFNLYLEGNVYYGPLVNYINEFDKLRDQSNILFINYEDMKRDLKKVIRSTADFLGKTINAEQVDELYQYLQPESMRKNKACNQEDMLFVCSTVCHSLLDPDFIFIRKATTDTYKDEMSQQFIEKFEEQIERKIERLSVKEEIIGKRLKDFSISCEER